MKTRIAEKFEQLIKKFGIDPIDVYRGILKTHGSISPRVRRAAGVAIKESIVAGVRKLRSPTKQVRDCEKLLKEFPSRVRQELKQRASALPYSRGRKLALSPDQEQQFCRDMEREVRKRKTVTEAIAKCRRKYGYTNTTPTKLWNIWADHLARKARRPK